MSQLVHLKAALALKIKHIIMQNKRLFIIVLIVIILLTIPLMAMQLTDDVNWTLPDFIVAAALLLGTGLLCEFTLKKVNQPRYRIAICLALLLLLLMIWAELAVGIFGTPLSGH
jgi:peptidoglycan/LPS O-acetylase OafA/YrhL